MLRHICGNAKNVRRQERGRYSQRFVSGRDTPDASGAGEAPGRESGVATRRFCIRTKRPGQSSRPKLGGRSPCGKCRPRRSAHVHIPGWVLWRAASASEEAHAAANCEIDPKGKISFRVASQTSRRISALRTETPAGTEPLPSARRPTFPKKFRPPPSGVSRKRGDTFPKL